MDQAPYSGYMVVTSGMASVGAACGGPGKPVPSFPSGAAPVGGVGSGVARLEKLWAAAHEVHSMNTRQRLSSRLKSANGLG